MIMRKETLVFLASLAIIFIIGINMSLTPDNAFDDLETGQMSRRFEVTLQNSEAELMKLICRSAAGGNRL